MVKILEPAIFYHIYEQSENNLRPYCRVGSRVDRDTRRCFGGNLAAFQRALQPPSALSPFLSWCARARRVPSYTLFSHVPQEQLQELEAQTQRLQEAVFKTPLVKGPYV